MKKVIAIAAIVAAAQFVGSAVYADTMANNEEKISVVKVAPEEFSVRIVEDSKIPKGVEVVIQEGIKGEKTFYKASESFRGASGQFDKVPVFYDEITKLPVEKVVRKGTDTDIISGVSDKTKEIEANKAAEKLAAEQAAAAKKKEEEEKAEAATKAKIAAEIKTNSFSAPLSKAPSASGVTSPTENQEYARSILSEADFSCLNFIVGKESGWSTTATNPSSGAYGVAQSLPASKMASAGSDWQTNGKTQVNWMISYLAERYGSPCQGQQFWLKSGWY